MSFQYRLGGHFERGQVFESREEIGDLAANVDLELPSLARAHVQPQRMTAPRWNSQSSEHHAARVRRELGFSAIIIPAERRLAAYGTHQSRRNM